ncbi:MAG: M20/M25/M40 family metallo-hydrolase [Alicyclobacillaceae bacterium]|nr:M20/M25/M40 family metallo-hydrolase [Alicyclobacillaceae bacterium]
MSLHGGPGFEHRVAEYVKGALAPLCTDVCYDRMGNLVARIAGDAGDADAPADPHADARPAAASAARPKQRPPRLMLAAHVDEIALIVTRIEEGGFLRVAQTGGFDPRTLVGQEVVVHASRPLRGVVGSKPPHLTTPEERKKAPSLEDLFIDLAMPEVRVREQVRVGDRVTIHRDPLELMNGRIAGKALDNRASAAVLLECARTLRSLRHEADVYLVCTVQEEVGMRGAAAVVETVRPDIAIAVDVTFGDFPGQAPDESFKLGKGPAITFGPNIHPQVFGGLRDTAVRHHIPYQIELSQEPTGTDANAFQTAGDGVATGLVGVAIRYVHTSVECVAYADIEDCGRLLAFYATTVDRSVVEGLSCY